MTKDPKVRFVKDLIRVERMAIKAEEQGKKALAAVYRKCMQELRKKIWG